MPEFTPGIWKAHKQPETDWVRETWEIHYTDDGECVAEVVHGEANARLMAASKDMYKALKKARDGMALLSGTYEEAENALLAIDAALAKAEGKE